MILGRKGRSVRYDRDHDLSGRPCSPDLYGAQQAKTGLFVVDSDLKGRQHRIDGLNNDAGSFILDQAVGDRDDFM